MSAKLIKENRVTAMRRELLDELMTVSEEESKYRAGQNLKEKYFLQMVLKFISVKIYL